MRISLPNISLKLRAALCALVGLLALLGCPGGKPANQPAPGAPQNAAQTTPEVLPQFTDITAEAGISFVHQNSKTPRKYLIETMGSGGAFLDYDNDGWQDIILLNNTLIPGGKVEGRPTLKLYRNLGNSKFEDVTAKVGLDKDSLYAMGVTIGDYDRDGWQDIYVSCALGSGKLYHNEKGRFLDVAAQAGVANNGKWSTSCVWVDYDKDGLLDLFVCSYVKYGSLKEDRPCYSGDKLIYCIPSAYDPSSCTLFHNNGNGKFTDVSEQTGIAAAKGKALGVSVWDYNGDGWPDLFVANDTVPGFLFRNEGGKKFTDVGPETTIAYADDGSPHSGMGIDACDAFNNGKTTVVITNYYGQQTSFYNQTGTDVFRDDRTTNGTSVITGKTLGFGIQFFDYDNDGWKDLLQVSGHVQDDVEEREAGIPFKQSTLLFRNTGGSTLTEVGLKSGAPFTERIVGRGFAWGDIDNDGRLDVLITENNGRARLWHNNTKTQNHWLGVRLKSEKSAPDGIGALITVKAGDTTQRAAIRTGSSYLSQNDLRAHFGLGSQTKAEIEVRWASGATDKITDIASDRYITVREGSGKAE